MKTEGWRAPLEDKEGEQLEWFTDETASHLIRVMTPVKFIDWLTDRGARKPTGLRARNAYCDPTYHRPTFMAILDYLKLKESDYLIEAGCGGRR